MNADFPVEKHLLTRSYTSDETIHEILLTRYAGSEAAAALFLALVPTGIESAAEDRNMPPPSQNMVRKSLGPRKINARREMRVYLKKTLANQKKAVAKLRYSQKHGQNADLPALLDSLRIPSYDQYVALNDLWQKYMHELLFSELKDPDLKMMMPRLACADYNGCHVRVLEARDRNIVGAEGIVVFDAQHLFVVVVPQKTECNRTLSPAQQVGGMRLLKKRGTLFGFTVRVDANECVDFTIVGSRMELRAVDRTARKFKSHGVEDIY